MSNIIRTDPTVIFQRLDVGAVLFSPSTELYFALNDVGSWLWERLSAGTTTPSDLALELSARYPEVESSILRADVDELVQQLVQDGLVLRESPLHANGPGAA
ncbi:MAG: PqqD family protein [Gemmatimonadaceae bacterium]